MPSQWLPLDFFGPAYRNVAETGLSRLSHVVMNTYIDEANHSQKRPGLLDWVDLGTAAPIDGVFWWETEALLIVLSDKRVWRIDNPGGAATEYGGTGTFLKNVPATFATDTVRAYLANGAKMVHFTRTGSLTDMADGDAPTNVSHVAFIDQYILANLRGTGQWQFSEVTDGIAWRAVDIVTAESSPDNLLAIHTSVGEIILLGATSTEYWVNDGVSPFSVIHGTTLSLGAGSPHTFALLGDPARAHWFTNTRRVIEIPSDKRIPIMTSLSINADLDSLSDVSDARGFQCTIDGLPLYILTFPNADRTFVYNYDLKHWGEWSSWDVVRGVNRRWRANNYAYAKAWNLHIIGDHSNGKLYKASRTYFNDAGDLIRLTRKTGFVDHDVSTLKRCFALRFKFKRAQGNADVSDPKFLLRWRNDSGAWRPFREASLGAEGDHDFYVTFHSLGSYRSRQWELVYTDDAGFELNGVKELVDTGGAPTVSTASTNTSTDT